ncbi:amidase [Actinomadura decatromicini]|uniref:Amidase n=1 Tax=Actinomadura decatromicini TaxID=2604572 RepID=A0A5D3FU59_9ACTN|nr:amidase [Actinomadura decatromicini]TYK51406.1 amidase [Actinomadura decatromicini]
MSGVHPPDEPTLLQLRERFRSREDTPLAAVERALDRMDAHDGTIHAFLAVDRDRALAEAETATKAWRAAGPRPALLGLPISVKDTIEVAGMPTTYGSAVFRHNRRPDSVIAERLRRHGAIIIGKTNTSEFALCTDVRNRLTGPGRNPLDTARSCGGSSGGAAASVAAGMSAAAVGTDSAGSIRIPAAYQGLVGFKPSFRRVPWVQDWNAAPTRSHPGPITRDARDAWELTKALGGADWRDPASALAPLADEEFESALRRGTDGLRVAFIADTSAPTSAGASAEVSASEEAALARDLTDFLRDVFGALDRLRWDRLVPPPTTARVWPYAAEHVAAALRLSPDFFDAVEELTDYARPIYEAGRTQSAAEYLRATGEERERGLALRHALAAYDYAFSVVAPEPPRVTETYSPLQFPRLALLNLAGLPAVSVPFGAYRSGMPRAMQIFGRFGDDAGVLAMAEKLTRSL